MIVFLNGRFLPEDEAKVSTFDHGFLYGDGVYETLRTYNGKIWQLAEHLRRLKNSAGLLCLSVPWPRSQLAKWLKKTVLLNKFAESRIRITLTRGRNNFDFTTCKKPTLCIQVKKLLSASPKVYRHGVNAVTMRMERLLPDVKSLSLLPQAVARRFAAQKKAYEAIYVDDNNYVREGTVTNVFMVKDGVLFTSAIKILPGITRQFLLNLAIKINLKAVELDFKVDRLYKADEVFITNAVKGIVPVVSVDRHKIGNGLPGSLTQKLSDAFKKAVSAQRK